MQRGNAGFTTSTLDEQALFALQQAGFFPQPLQSIPGTSNQNQEPIHCNEFLKELLKVHFASTATGCGNQQQNKAVKELSRRRPSLMHDSGASLASHNDARSSILSDNQKRLHLSHAADSATPVGYVILDPREEEDEKQKRILNEQLDKIEQERIQTANLQKNALKKARKCETVLRQEPFMLTEEYKEDNGDSEDDLNEQTPAEALIERIYAENRRKAAASGKNERALLHPPSESEATRDNINISRLTMRAEDTARLSQEYERGVQLLPMLVQAMRIQRNRRQEALETQRTLYEEQLAVWERKVMAAEKNPKKLGRDLKHRELFEKTFVELRKLREEKERNLRVERSRFCLAQGGNGISGSSEAIIHHFVNNSNESNENEQHHCDNDEESVDEKAYSAAIVPPTYITRPRRFFDNCNTIVENAFVEASARLEAFLNQWSDVEKAVFMEKIGIFGKNFAAIAAFLPLKSVKECVLFYYMTKKRNNYKQKFGRKRKKIGRQGYRPPVMPRFGDTDENVQLQNYGRDCTFVECLLCGTRILVLESLGQQPHHQHFDNFGACQPSALSQQQQIPICTKCQSQAQRNRTLNRCPLGSCACIGGKRKMRPVRNMPEKFATLDIEYKRFLIYRLKIPPTTNKCCTNCFKRIAKDIEELLIGEFKDELEAFNNRPLIQTETTKSALIIGSDSRALVETKKELFEGKDSWENKEGPPPKELKLEVKEELEEEQEDTCKVKTESTGDEAILVDGPSQFPHGSLTKGIPNRNKSSILDGTLVLQSSSEQPQISSHQNYPFVANIAKTFNAQKMASVTDSCSFEDFASKMLTQFGVVLSKQMSDETNRMVTADKSVLPSADTDNSNQTKPSKHVEHEEKEEGHSKADNNRLPDSQEQQKTRDNKMRRKSGLANVLLPSAALENNGGSVTRISHQTTTSSSPALCLRKDELLPEKEESKVTENTDQSQQQPISCYESLSDDSDNDGNYGEGNRKSPLGGGFQQSVTGAPVGFFSLFDLMEDEEGTSVGTSGLTSSSLLPIQPRPSSPHFLSTQWDNKAFLDNKKLSEGTAAGECVYEPLSEDES